MRSSNSRDKPSSSGYGQNRLMKTQGPPKTQTQKESLNNTQYRLPPSNPANKRIESSKTSSTKPMPKQQLNFDIDSHMTQSKIYTAKESLQLLKKKMNRTGMSRQKPTSSNNINNPMQKTTYTTTSMKKVPSEKQKNIQNYQPEYQPKNYKSPPLKQSQSYNQTQPKRQTMARQPKPKVIESRQNNQMINKNTYDQKPLAPKQDFYVLLQQQMKKEQSNNIKNSNLHDNIMAKGNSTNQAQMPSEYADDVELVECRKGCGRMFNPQVLAKHQKVCQKVFQSKRKVFNTAAQRQLEQGMTQTTQKPFKKVPQKKKQPETNKIPKWKIESAQFRAGLKAVSNKPLSKQQQQIQNMQKDSLIPCHVCGRKFNETAAQRHIPVCENKAKMMPRGSNTRKK